MAVQYGRHIQQLHALVAYALDFHVTRLGHELRATAKSRSGQDRDQAGGVASDFVSDQPN